jgi:hypothetical protein
MRHLHQGHAKTEEAVKRSTTLEITAPNLLDFEALSQRRIRHSTAPVAAIRLPGCMGPGPIDRPGSGDKLSATSIEPIA